MNDIIHRLKKYRLSRYAPPENPLRRRLRWVLPLGGFWFVYIVALSDHSLYRIWRLSEENSRVKSSLEAIRGEIGRLDRQLRDPTARRSLAERTLREREGMARPGEIIYRIRGETADSLKR